MDAIDYCADKVATQGTPGYYVVLFQPPSVRAALIALRALERELSDVAELCTDQAVAQRKLSYWQQELHSNNSLVSHPVTRALQQFANGVLDDDARSRLIAATAQRIGRAQIRDDSELDQLSTASAGTIAHACAQITGEARAGVTETAIAAERLRLLSMPQRAGLPAHSGIALSTLTACAVTPQQVDRGGIAAGLVPLRQSLLEHLGAATQQADHCSNSGAAIARPVCASHAYYSLRIDAMTMLTVASSRASHRYRCCGTHGGQDHTNLDLI